MSTVSRRLKFDGHCCSGRLLGRMLKTLEQLDQADSTAVMVFGDHGFVEGKVMGEFLEEER